MKLGDGGALSASPVAGRPASPRLRLAAACGGKYRWVIWSVVSLVAFYQNCQLFAYSVLVPSLLAELRLSYALAGTLSSAYGLASILVMAPAGLLSDRLGWRRLVVCGLATMSLGTYLFASADSYAQAFFSRMLLGLGAGIAMILPTPLLAFWFSKAQYRSVLGLHISVGKMGSIVATWLLPALIGALGWRLGFGVVALLGPLALAGALLLADEPVEVGLPGGGTLAVPRASRSAARPEPAPPFARVVRNRDLLLLSASQCLFFVAYFGTINWLPTYLQTVVAVSETEAGLLTGFILWGTIIGFALSGPATNYFGRCRPLYSGGMLATAVMTALLAASALPAVPSWSWPPLMLLYGLCLSTMVLMNPILAGLVPGPALGTANGILFTLSFTGSMAGPPLLGIVADLSGALTNGFWLGAACAATGSLTSLLIREGGVGGKHVEAKTNHR